MESFLQKVLGVGPAAGGKEQQERDLWVNDAACKACYECDIPFSLLVRRHHCRVCGRIFCASCTSHAIPPGRDAADPSWLRVCNFCECTARCA